MIFLASIDDVQYFYWILTLPAFCIAVCKMTIDLTRTAKKNNICSKCNWM